MFAARDYLVEHLAAEIDGGETRNPEVGLR
jgi:hypothetical protein